MSTKQPKKLRVLFADDEPSLRNLIEIELPRMGHEAVVCADGVEAVAALEKASFDCMIVDLNMPRMGGIEVITKAREIAPNTDAVVLTGQSSVESAIAALRQGAFDYLTKPCKLMELQALLLRVAEKRELAQKYQAAKRRIESLEGAARLIGKSDAMLRVQRLISQVGPTESTVLILGETGVGKELVARALHDASDRKEMPYVAINCGALPESLIESELFGHRKGSFTGADESRTGLFEVADGGTLFLDEIGELPKAMQAKLLRFLESGELRRVGENHAIQSDVRVICATNRDLEQMVIDDEFRDDLMFRINTFEIRLPPLRERLDDLPELAEHLFLKSRRGAAPVDQAFTPEAMSALQAHQWPGNVRELANVVEHAAIINERPPIDAGDLPENFGARRLKKAGLGDTAGKTLRELEIEAIHDSLDRHSGNKPAAAQELGISLKTLYNKLNQADQLERSA